MQEQTLSSLPKTILQSYVEYVNRTMYEPDTIRRRDTGFHVHVVINSFLIIVWLMVPLFRRVYRWINPKLSKRPVRTRTRENSVMPMWRRLYHVLHACLCVVMLIAAIPYSKDSESSKWLCWWAYISTTIFFILLTIPVPFYDGWVKTWTRFCLKYLIFPVSDVQSLANFGYWYLGLIHDRWDYVWAHYIPHAYLLIIIIVHIREYDDELNPFTQSVWYWIFTTNIASPFLIAYYYSVNVHEEYRMNMDACVRFAVFTKLNVILLFVFIGICRTIFSKYFDKEPKRVLLSKKSKNKDLLKESKLVTWRDFLKDDDHKIKSE